MFVPKLASSTSLPCSAKSLHCEHPWAKRVEILKNIRTKRRMSLCFMAKNYVYKVTIKSV